MPAYLFVKEMVDCLVLYEWSGSFVLSITSSNNKQKFLILLDIFVGIVI